MDVCYLVYGESNLKRPNNPAECGYVTDTRIGIANCIGIGTVREQPRITWGGENVIVELG